VAVAAGATRDSRLAEQREQRNGKPRQDWGLEIDTQPCLQEDGARAALDRYATVEPAHAKCRLLMPMLVRSHQLASASTPAMSKKSDADVWNRRDTFRTCHRMLAHRRLRHATYRGLLPDSHFGRCCTLTHQTTGCPLDDGTLDTNMSLY